jgi:hypothetical protein
MDVTPFNITENLPPEIAAIVQQTMQEIANSPQDVFYTEDVCDMRYEPGHIGIVERTTNDVDSHDPHPDPDMRCHSLIPREAYRKYGCLVSWRE